jgi:uncharacterized protein (DUF362 family)
MRLPPVHTFTLAAMLALGGCTPEQTGNPGSGGSPASSGGTGPGEGGTPSGGTATGGAPAGHEVVAIVQSTTAEAGSITMSEIRSLVSQAVTLAGGLDFIGNNQTVVLKPNLVTTTTGTTPLVPEANGVTTDWRIALAVAELVRARNPDGQVLVMEGSAASTTQAFAALGYTTQNFGSVVNSFIAFEGNSCTSPSAAGLVQRTAVSGKTYWINQTYVDADVVISLPTLKTHTQAGITGGVKNLGIGTTPAAKYATAGHCNRLNVIPHDRAGLHQWIYEFYSLRPADFVVMDGLRGMANGPEPSYADGGNYDVDRKNMRLILAARNAVALDTIETLVMCCTLSEIGYLHQLAASGFGPADPSLIDVVGKTVSEVRLPLVGPSWACPG